MSREVILRIRPGESVDEFTSRIADTAPALTPDLAARLRTLLCPDIQAQPVARTAPRDERQRAA